MKLFWNIFCLLAVAGTYYGAWQHNWVIILISAIPQFLTMGYGIAKNNK
jgi:phage-related holin